jgi:hypothetical protein
MGALSRFQMDLSESELQSMERLSEFAGFRTKREFFLNAFTLFQWAAKQVMLGRTICAMDEATGEVRHLEFPALQAIAAKVPPISLSPNEVRRRLAEPSRPLAEVLAELKEPVREEAIHGDHEQKRRERAGSANPRPSRAAARNRRTV